MASLRQTQATIYVLVVAPHLLVAQYLLTLLSEEPAIRAVPFDSPGSSKIARKPSVLLVDCSGLPLPLCEFLPRLRPRDSDGRFVVLDEEVMDADRMVQLGIHGFLPYSDVAKALIPALRAVAQGKTWIRTEVLQEYMCKTLIAHNGGFPHGNGLTRRESVTLELVKRRMSNNEIAGILGLRESTVKFHISNLFSKLQVKNRRDLFKREEAVHLWNKLLLLHSSARRESAVPEGSR
jgi:DNA-binding NarL/FixJ family response regulator